KNQDGAALMPCTEAKARKLLKAGQAKIVDYRPFTIQLSWQCEGHVQHVTCGIDKGNSVTGFACVANGAVLRPRQTRKRYHSQPQKGKGRVEYQVNNELQGFRKGDLVLVKGKYVKLIRSIYSDGYLAFPRVRGEPSQALPRDCRILEREGTILWEKGR